MKTNNKHQILLDEVTTALGSASGSVLLSQVGGQPGAIVGAGIGGLVGLFISRNAGLVVDLFQRKDKFVRELVRDKVDADFDDSFLSDSHLADWAITNARDFTTFGRSQAVPKPDRRFETLYPVEIASGLLDDLAVREKLEDLRKYRSRIRISCTVVCAAAVGVLKRMQAEYGDERKYGKNALCLEIDFEPSNGRDQVTKLINSDPFDFTIVPNDPLAFADYKKTSEYQLLLPCHGADQVLFVRKGARYQRSWPVHVLVESSAELHSRYHKALRGYEKRPIQDAEQIPELIENMAGGEGILAWNPLSSSLRNNPAYEEIHNTHHRIYYCLRCHKNWTANRASRARAGLQALFVNQWRYCNRNRRLVYSLLLQDREYLARFAKGAGIMGDSR